MNDTLQIQAIGHLRSAQHRKFELPPQPDGSNSYEGIVELLPQHNYEVATRDLEGFSRIWLLWWFHKNQNWRPTTLPPRGRSGRKGTFATRSPYRPNPLAMSNVELLAVDGLYLYIGPHDLLADTPILDIKPYIAKFDAFPDARSGWFGDMEEALERNPDFELQFEAEALKTLQSLSDDTLQRRIEGILGQDPHPHRGRRIVTYEDGYRLSCGDWRIFFSIEEQVVRIQQISLR